MELQIMAYLGATLTHLTIIENFPGTFFKKKNLVNPYVQSDFAGITFDTYYPKLHRDHSIDGDVKSGCVL